MRITRNEPRIEGRALLRHLFRALVAGSIALAVLAYEFDLRRLLITATGTPTWRGIGIVPTFALLAGIVAFACLAAAVRRMARWLTALRHARMLKDPQRAALVPPLPSHLQSLTPTLGRQIRAACGYVLVSTLVVAGLASMQYAGSPSEDPDDAMFAWLFAMFLLVASLYGLVDSVLRWLRTRRAARASRVGADVRDHPAAPPVDGAPRIPSLTVSYPIPDTASHEALAVTVERNIFGRPPWNIAYLRLFDNESGLQRFLKGLWRQCGYVHFIRDADSVSREEIRAIENGARLFVSSRAHLLADLEGRPLEPLPPGEREFHCLAAETVHVDDPYGSYPVFAPLCYERFWKAALDVLLERADVVVLDLSGYHWENLGTGYELQRVIDRFPIERCVFLADPAHADKLFLEAQIQRAWSQMASGSPNQGDAPRQVVVVQSGLFTRDHALAAMLQDRLERVASYAARVGKLSEQGAAEQRARETARRQALRERYASVSPLRILLRLWGLPRF